MVAWGVLKMGRRFTSNHDIEPQYNQTFMGLFPAYDFLLFSL